MIMSLTNCFLKYLVILFCLMITKGVDLMDLNKWFDQGISKQAYKNTLTNHKDAFNHIYEHFSFPNNNEDYLEKIKNQNLRVLIIAQEFCGHCMLDVPIMFRLAEKTNMPVSVLVRDDNLDLMDQYLTNEKRVIPIFIFINEDGEEVAKWGPFAPEIKEYVDNLNKDMPPKDDPNFDEAFKSLIEEVGHTFKYDGKYWHYVYDDLIKKLTK